MSDLKERQQALLHSISRALENFKKLGRNNYTPAKVRSRMSALKETWAQCLQTHAAIIRTFPDEETKAQQTMDRHEDIFQTALDHMAEELEELEPPVSPNQSFASAPARSESSAFSLQHLPPIQLPPFSGRLEEWETFRDRFQSLIIHNKELTNFGRMHFLASSVTGRARDAIAKIRITADNFEVAWKALCARFENKRRLVEAHVATLCNLPQMSRESAPEMHALRDTVDQALASLRNLDRTAEDILNDILVYSVSQKLDPVTRRSWKLKLGEDALPPSYQDLGKFLSSRAQALEELKPVASSKSTRQTATSAAASISPEIKCALCQMRHLLHKCPKFVGKGPSQRRDLVKQHKRCFNCLSDKHSVNTCQSKFSCRTCQQRHHTMLHVDSPSPTNSNAATVEAVEAAPSPVAAPVVALASFATQATPSPVLLATAQVIVRSASGRSLQVRALLDQGSEVTLVAERVVQSLRLRRIRTSTSISTVGCASAGTCRHVAKLQLACRDGLGPTFSTLAYVLPSLTKYVPRGAPVSSAWTHLADLKLADADPTGSEPIDLLIGADLFSSLLVDGVRKGPADQPIAQNTHFGWVLSGPTGGTDISRCQIVTNHCSLEQDLRKFWEMEEVPQADTSSPDDRRCEAHFLSTHSREPDGRYVVRLPFREGPPIEIGDSRLSAQRMLAGLTRRLSRDPDLQRAYSAFMSEYGTLGHMIRVPPPASDSPQTVYIPHHPVIRETSSTTRVRVVFNASCDTSNGTSLNSHLLAGPKLQTDLVAVLLRWRQYKYVYTADIAKMYRQILIDPRDRDYQRILWVAEDSTVQDYQLTTVTYGTASAPYLALRVLQQLSHDEGDAFPLGTSILRDHIYVDDVLFGAENIPLLHRARAQVCALLQRGGFQLRKWASNRAELLTDIPPDDHGLACNKLMLPDERLSVLGLSWKPALDVFQIHVAVLVPVPRTKREVLSTIARLFDPMGWVAPVIIAAKIIMQQLWRCQCGWDEAIPPTINSRWTDVYNSLSDIDNFAIPRWTSRGSETLSCELHGFADASSLAYAAAVYMRVQSLSGEVAVTLLAAKSKVAPVKPMTIPRLELAAAVLLARLLAFVRESLAVPIGSCYCWTDSTVALAWLRQHPSRWKTFVAHRVSFVQSRFPFAHWRHVPTADNPADCASRGLLGAELAAHELWWRGPSWLRLDRRDWPTGPSDDPGIPTSPAVQEETRAIVAQVTVSADLWGIASGFSTWPRLLRVTAYILRFADRCRRRERITSDAATSTSGLTASECRRSATLWLKALQAELFPREIHSLRKGNSLPAKSSILTLNPFLDEDGLIRVGGRLQNAPLPFQSRHPILLSSHPLVRLIVRHAHYRALHAGVKLTLSTVRREYWILRARTLVKSVIHGCVPCVRERAAVPAQLMGQLPRSRVAASTRPFVHCGVDYAGPIAVRSAGGRGIKSHKCYVALFVCLATRAIHLELVGGYATPAFLDAYSRFCARRGLPEIMYSDNGTTFTGADREMTQAYRSALRNPEFQNRTASDRVTWKFMPPHSPHFGGLWEAGVKSVKHHLHRVLGTHTLTYEELSTLLCQIESCLNSRPLGPFSDSLEDFDALTPGHFLVGTALNAYPEPSVLELNENRLSRWQRVRHIAERFWKYWQGDYVNTLQQRSKWQQAQPSVRAGTMVLLRDSNLPPRKWALGRVVRCHPGPDGLVRVVSVRTASSEYKRPLAKLCLLPIDIESRACPPNRTDDEPR